MIMKITKFLNILQAEVKRKKCTALRPACAGEHLHTHTPFLTYIHPYMSCKWNYVLKQGKHIPNWFKYLSTLFRTNQGDYM